MSAKTTFAIVRTLPRVATRCGCASVTAILEFEGERPLNSQIRLRFQFSSAEPSSIIFNYWPGKPNQRIRELIPMVRYCAAKHKRVGGKNWWFAS